MSEENTNMSLWDRVKNVDESATKQANVDGNKQTSINTLYPIKTLTEAFGPIGLNWTYEIDFERFDKTKPMEIKGEYLRDGEDLLWELTHTLCLNLFIKHEGQKDFVKYQHFGHTKYRYVTGAGKIYVDHEYAKKSVSDALKKSLSLLGVCADVYSGDFDDIHYRAEVQDKLAIERADKNTEEQMKQIDEMKVKLEQTVKALDLVPNLRAAKLVNIQAVKYFEARLNTEKFSSIAKKCMIELKEKMDETINKFENTEAE